MLDDGWGWCRAEELLGRETRFGGAVRHERAVAAEGVEEPRLHQRAEAGGRRRLRRLQLQMDGEEELRIG